MVFNFFKAMSMIIMTESELKFSLAVLLKFLASFIQEYETLQFQI